MIRATGDHNQVEIRTDGYWRFRRLEDGSLRLLRKYSMPGNHSDIDANGPYWVIAVGTIRGGDLSFVANGDTVPVRTKRFGFFLARNCLVDWRFKNIRYEMDCILSARDLPGGFGRTSFLFDPGDASLPADTEKTLRWAASRKRVAVIERSIQRSSRAAAVKAEIDSNRLAPERLGQAAARLEISATALGRSFRRTFGISPSRYRRQIRIVESCVQLMNSRPIVDVFQDVGFDDLSRFYKQFKLVTAATPGQYRPRP